MLPVNTNSITHTVGLYIIDITLLLDYWIDLLYKNVAQTSINDISDVFSDALPVDDIAGTACFV